MGGIHWIKVQMVSQASAGTNTINSGSLLAARCRPATDETSLPWSRFSLSVNHLELDRPKLITLPERPAPLILEARGRAASPDVPTPL